MSRNYTIQEQLELFCEALIGNELEFNGCIFDVQGIRQQTYDQECMKVSFIAKKVQHTADYIIACLEDANPEKLNSLFYMDEKGTEYFIRCQNINEEQCVSWDSELFCVVSKVIKTNNPTIPFLINNNAEWQDHEMGINNATQYTYPSRLKSYTKGQLGGGK